MDRQQIPTKEQYVPLYSWHDTYSIGNEEIDYHHKSLFNILNSLYDSSFEPDNTVTFNVTLDKLISYADYHFETEEQYMQDNKYNDIGRQTTEHLYFKQRVSELKKMSIKTNYESCHDVLVFLGDWLIQHVMIEDKKITAMHDVVYLWLFQATKKNPQKLNMISIEDVMVITLP